MENNGFKYIGIRGHRGSGKRTIGYLMGAALEILSNSKDSEDAYKNYNDIYNELVSNIENNKWNEFDFLRIQYESFSDTPKAVLSMILNIPIDRFYQDCDLDAIHVNLRTFEWDIYNPCDDERPEWVNHIIQNSEVLIDLRMDELIMDEIGKFTEDTWVSLRTLIYYFGVQIMQSFFGANVWVKSLRVNQLNQDKFYLPNSGTKFKIFSDVRFPSEVDYIKENDGLIIEISRPENRKKATEISDKLYDDERIDFSLKLPKDDLMLMKDEIFNIAEKIFNK